jgi:hypothetical protein
VPVDKNEAILKLPEVVTVAPVVVTFIYGLATALALAAAKII